MVHFMFAIAVLATIAGALAETAQEPHRKIEIQCGKHKIVITCSKETADLNYADDKRQCNRNTLSFTGPDGKVFFPRQPNNFRQEFVMKKTPVSVACAQGKDGHQYVTVEFSACPSRARYAGCIVYDLFTSNGQRLTVNGLNLDSTQAKLGIPYTQQLEIEGGLK